MIFNTIFTYKVGKFPTKKKSLILYTLVFILVKFFLNVSKSFNSFGYILTIINRFNVKEKFHGID